MTVDLRVAGLGQEQGQSAAVVVVAVTEHQKVGDGRIDTQEVGVIQQGRSLTGVEQQPRVAGFQPQGKAVFGLQAGTGLVID
jgi:hypothetical protein